MKNKKIGTSILAFLLAAATAAAGAQPVLAADLGTVTDNVPAIVAASASVSVIDASGDLEAAYGNGVLCPMRPATTCISSRQAAATRSWIPCWYASIRIASVLMQ